MVLRALFSCGVAAVLVAALTGCSSEDVGGPSKGPADVHCKGKKPQPTSMKVCEMQGTADDEGYPDPMYGSEGDDDDCKYHVKWSSTDIVQNENITFTMSATKLADGSVASGSDSYIEAFLDDKHPAPSTTPASTSKEDPKGTYTIGPVKFDAKGKWTVRFHLYEQCTDISEESPHGHAAFFVDVP